MPGGRGPGRSLCGLYCVCEAPQGCREAGRLAAVASWSAGVLEAGPGGDLGPHRQRGGMERRGREREALQAEFAGVNHPWVVQTTERAAKQVPGSGASLEGESEGV